MEELIREDEPTDGIVFPLKRRQLYKLMLPHLCQIRQYAQFYLEYEELVKLKESGADTAALQEKVNSLPFEVQEYNCVIGLWGQPEARYAYLKMHAFCKENGLVTPDRGAVKFLFKRRMYDYICVAQRGRQQQVFVHPACYEAGAPVGVDLANQIIGELVEEGALVRRESDGYVALPNWESYKYDFTI